MYIQPAQEAWGRAMTVGGQCVTVYGGGNVGRASERARAASHFNLCVPLLAC